MPMFVALLRGVNVGKANRLPMADLRDLFIGMGYSRVATLLNSGNIVFHAEAGASARHGADIAAALATTLNVQVPVVVKSAEELDDIIAAIPIPARVPDHPRLLVAFVQDVKQLPDLAVLATLVVAPERFAVGKGAAYLLCARGIIGSKIAAALAGKPGRSATSRNWATLLKLQSLMREH
jgi:uncharacterized protein (DUF1697 family)